MNINPDAFLLNGRSHYQSEEERIALVKRIRHLEGKLKTIEILTQGRHGSAGIHYLAESALMDQE